MKSRSISPSAVRLLLRDLSSQLSQLNHRVGGRAQLRDGDLACLDLLARQGPLSPSSLARLLQIHPATLTGVLDRLEKEGWIRRERDPEDRRAVLIQVSPDRVRELMGHYAGMNGAVERIAAAYNAEELAIIGDFLTQLIAAGRAANDELAD